jgi:hypothetical protein
VKTEKTFLQLAWLCICTLLLANAPADAAKPIALDRSPDLIESVSLEPVEEAVPSFVPVTGGWRMVLATPQYRVWETSLPVRPRTLFFRRAPDDMAIFQRADGDKVWSKSKKLTHTSRESGKQGVRSWYFTQGSLAVRRAPDAGPPNDWEYSIRYTKATEREASMRYGREDKAEDFIFRSLQVADQTRHGIYLPAPAQVSFKLVPPKEAVLGAQLTMLPPEAADPARPSDGASLRIQVITKEGEDTVLEMAAEKGRYRKIRIDLSEYAGQEITLRFDSDPGNSPDYDYLFLADPILYTPVERPKRVVMVFIDTLRQDGMSLYGYERETTPKLDEWAEGAGVFTQARSIAPWTLPSAKTMMSGTVPERWGKSPKIQERFAAEGWATAFLAGNIYLSSSFGLAEGWGLHRCVNWPIAEVQLERAKEFLEENEDRPALMMLHLMDMHLPYTEPQGYRNLFAGKGPPDLPRDQFNRSEVLKAVRKGGEESKQYIRDRYDNNLRYIDDQLSAFLGDLGEDDVVAIFADHGEEFWDHGNFEHGHSFYDELIKVPFIVKAAGVPTGVHDDPISLLDLAPTMAKAAGIEMPGAEGWPLQELDQRDFSGRPQAFGRVLYGYDGWASYYQGVKYVTREGEERLYDLRQDPGEKEDQSKDPDLVLRGRFALQEALGTEVKEGFRLYLNRSSSSKDAVVDLTLPQGLLETWQGTDPTKKGKHKLEQTEDGLTGRWYGRQGGQREVFLIPKGPLGEALAGLSFRMRIAGDSAEAKSKVPLEWPPPERKSLFTAKLAGRTAYLTYAVVPLPMDDAEELIAIDEEVSEELKVLGYVEE